MGGVANESKDMTSVLLVVVVSPLTGEPRLEGLGWLVEVYNEQQDKIS